MVTKDRTVSCHALPLTKACVKEPVCRRPNASTVTASPRARGGKARGDCLREMREIRTKADEARRSRVRRREPACTVGGITEETKEREEGGRVKETETDGDALTGRAKHKRNRRRE